MADRPILFSAPMKAPFVPFPILSGSLLHLAMDIDAYHMRASVIGVSRERAEAILAEEIERSKASRRLTAGDALEAARRRLVDEVY